ncbi:drug/metabolite transporter (DMT) superfamily permease [Brucella abortus]|nr:drug/metabolite transporter (DMT) superfamily permease [Brucella abortus]
MVRFYRWSAVLIGLFGVMIIIWPRLTLFSAGSVGRDEAVGALAALGAAVMSAVAMMLVRRLVQTERTPTIVIYFSISASVIALVSLPFGWVVPNWSQLAMLVGRALRAVSGKFCSRNAIAMHPCLRLRRLNILQCCWGW